MLIEMRKICLIGCYLLFLLPGVFGQQGPNQQYQLLQNSIAQGWNTWNTHSVLSHVKLPEGIALNIGFKSNVITGNRYLQEAYISKKDTRPEEITAGYHAWDGSYTECIVSWESAVYKIETAHDEKGIVMLITPVKLPEIKHHIVLEAGMLWNKQGVVQLKDSTIVIATGNNFWKIYATAPTIKDALPLTSPYLVFNCKKPIGISVGRKRNLQSIQQILTARRNIFETGLKKYGAQHETYLAQQSVLAWNMIYDPQRNAVIAPVSRVWNTFFGGHYVLFNWDTYLSGLMAGLDNKALAYANVVEVTKTIDQWGIVPNYISAHNFGSPDRSQPPLGSMVVWELFKRYSDRWLLELTYNQLLKWNRWWPKNRDTEGFLCWGSNNIPPDPSANTWQAAAYESGLDNSPMYDGIPFNKSTGKMELADVGLMSLYIADCKYLAEIAKVLQKTADVNELSNRSAYYTASLQKLWNDSLGIFLNKRTDNHHWSYRLSPTLFYPLIAKVATGQQAERMIKEHLLNKQEFWGDWVVPSIARNDTSFEQQDYWRGRIWAPLNFLVYKGLQNYPFPDVRKELAEKSNQLLLKNWHSSKGVYENYHASGIGRLPGEALNRSDNFYHWGALLGYMYLLEQQFDDHKHMNNQ